MEIRFFVLMGDTLSPQKEEAIRVVSASLENDRPTWLVGGRKAWAFDLDLLKKEFKELREWEWLRGRIYLEPEFEVTKEDKDITETKYFEGSVVFYITRETTGMSSLSLPPEIQNSIQEFRLDYPDPIVTLP